MRVFSHTCSNTEIVCALGCAEMLVGIDTDSDFPLDVVAPLPKLGRDLDLDVAGVIALQPDLVLTSLTVPGHERIVTELKAAGVKILVSDPRSLEDIYGDIRCIANALGADARGEALIVEMRTAMPPLKMSGVKPKVLIEWWPKPVIAPARQSWATDLVELAGGENPWAQLDAKSTTLIDAQIIEAAPQVVVMSWCGVREENYRADVVRRRAGWSQVPAVRDNCIVSITEAWLGRPGPRLVKGYRALVKAIASSHSGSSN